MGRAVAMFQLPARALGMAQHRETISSTYDCNQSYKVQQGMGTARCIMTNKQIRRLYGSGNLTPRLRMDLSGPAVESMYVKQQQLKYTWTGLSSVDLVQGSILLRFRASVLKSWLRSHLDLRANARELRFIVSNTVRGRYHGLDISGSSRVKGFFGDLNNTPAEFSFSQRPPR